MKNEVPIEFTSYSRFKNKKFLKGKKADILVCGNKNYGFSKETKCSKCGKVCYYTEDNFNKKSKGLQKKERKKKTIRK